MPQDWQTIAKSLGGFADFLEVSVADECLRGLTAGPLYVFSLPSKLHISPLPAQMYVSSYSDN